MVRGEVNFEFFFFIFGAVLILITVTRRFARTVIYTYFIEKMCEW